MTKKRQYQALIVLTLLITLYLLGTEAVNRWEGTGLLYDELLKREQTSLDPSELAATKVVLAERKLALTKKLAERSQTYEQTQAGLVKFLNAQARTSGFRFESLAPKELRTAGRLKEVGLTIDFQATYHQVGSFVNALESGPFPLEIDRADLIVREPGSSLLQARLEGRVALQKGTER